MKTAPWSKLWQTKYWADIIAAYDDPKRAYHNASHIYRMYRWAQFFGYQYDPNLDWAILLHDVVYDGGQHVEIRSAMKLYEIIVAETGQPQTQLPDQLFFCGQTIQPTKIQDLIMTTVNHSTHVDDIRLIELDLMDFIDVALRRTNSVNVLKELSILHPDVPKDELKKKNIDFMDQIRYRLLSNPSQTIKTIVKGIEAQFGFDPIDMDKYPTRL